MPHIIVKLYPGRTDDQKSKLTEQIVKDMVTTIGCKEESISIGFEEIDPQEWTEKVYKPEIKGKWETLSKKPGYDPLA